MSPRIPWSNRKLIDAIRRSGVVAPNPSTRQRRLEAVLRAAASVTSRPPDRSTVRPRWPFTPRLAPTMITSLIIAIVLATGVSTAVASDNAKPGDPLFGLDKALERFQLSLTFSDTGRADVEANIAAEREAERESLERDQKPDDDASDEADHALEQAQTTVEAVRAKLEAKGNDRAVQSLRRVEEKLKTLQARQEERREAEREQTETSDSNENENENENARPSSSENVPGDVKGAETEKKGDEDNRRPD